MTQKKKIAFYSILSSGHINVTKKKFKIKYDFNDLIEFFLIRSACL